MSRKPADLNAYRRKRERERRERQRRLERWKQAARNPRRQAAGIPPWGWLALLFLAILFFNYFLSR